MPTETPSPRTVPTTANTHEQNVRGPTQDQRRALAQVAFEGHLSLEKSAKLYAGMVRLRPSAP